MVEQTVERTDESMEALKEINSAGKKAAWKVVAMDRQNVAKTALSMAEMMAAAMAVMKAVGSVSGMAVTTAAEMAELMAVRKDGQLAARWAATSAD